MADTIKLKPAKGLLVAVPGERRNLREEGETVAITTYWRRRLADGDVVEIKGGESAAAAKKD